MSERADPPVDRAAAFSGGPPKLPRKYLTMGAAAIVLLGLGGVWLQRLFADIGLNPTKPPRAGTPRPAAPALLPSAIHVTHGSTAPRPGGRALDAFAGLQPLVPTRAPRFDLTTQRHSHLSLAQLRGKVVVLSFFDAACDDICPVIAKEVIAADRDLRRAAASVAFITLNTDPRALAWSPSPPAGVTTGLERLRNWSFLTGPLATMNPLWRAYGIGIEVAASGQIAHNEEIVVLGANGAARYRLTPVANESRTGAYGLSATSIARFASAIARTVESLLPQGR